MDTIKGCNLVFILISSLGKKICGTCLMQHLTAGTLIVLMQLFADEIEDLNEFCFKALCLKLFYDAEEGTSDIFSTFTLRHQSMQLPSAMFTTIGEIIGSILVFHSFTKLYCNYESALMCFGANGKITCHQWKLFLSEVPSPHPHMLHPTGRREAQICQLSQI